MQTNVGDKIDGKPGWTFQRLQKVIESWIQKQNSPKNASNLATNGEFHFVK